MTKPNNSKQAGSGKANKMAKSDNQQSEKATAGEMEDVAGGATPTPVNGQITS